MKRNALLLVFLIAVFCRPGHANSPDEINREAVSPQKLDRAIEELMKRREYQWRIPQERTVQEQDRMLLEFWKGALKVTKRWFEPVADLWRRFVKWIRDRFPSFDPSSSGSGERGLRAPLPLLLLLTVVVLAVLLFFFLKWRKQRASSDVVEAQPIAPVPDLQREDVVADQLPEDQWLELALDFKTKGEYRLALRALFMATLAHFAGSGLLRIARFKSNREYQRELNRKAQDHPDLLDAFEENVTVLERVWYGNHQASENMLTDFENNHQKMIGVPA